tara:strand:+ start:4585 stop:5106 length:522 start_codon:yes stop_codon:yes gene_type:complete
MSKIWFSIIFLFLFSGCVSYQQSAQNHNDILESGSKVTVKPKVVVESAYEGFYINDKLQAELNKIQFSSTTFLKGNQECVGLIRLSVSGSIDYYQLIQTLKKRTYDIGGNAIGVYDYQEKRRVLVNQHAYEITEKDKPKNIFSKPKINHVLVKDNRKIAKITADIFRCKKQST